MLRSWTCKLNCKERRRLFSRDQTSRCARFDCQNGSCSPVLEIPIVSRVASGARVTRLCSFASLCLLSALVENYTQKKAKLTKSWSSRTHFVTTPSTAFHFCLSTAPQQENEKAPKKVWNIKLQMSAIKSGILHVIFKLLWCWNISSKPESPPTFCVIWIHWASMNSLAFLYYSILNSDTVRVLNWPESLVD